MAADKLRIPHAAVQVRNVEKNTLIVPGEQGEFVTVQFWNPGCKDKDCWTGKKCPKVSFEDEKGDVITTTKRERFLRYCIQMVSTTACDVLSLVDCGVHEDGVEGLEEELMAIVHGWNDPKPEIQVHRSKSYIFLHKKSVRIENIEWRHLFPPSRLDADESVWKQRGFDVDAIKNLRSRRKWRGCLVVDVEMDMGRFKDGVVVSGSAASPAGHTKKVQVRQVVLHAPSGNKQVKTACGEVANHSTQGDRDVLTESLTAAITIATEQTLERPSQLWAVAGDFNLTREEAADNSNYVSDADDDVDDDDYVHFRRCRIL